MAKLKHVVLTNSGLRGFEYGSLCDFEDEIIRITGGELQVSPIRKLPRLIDRRIGHGTRYSDLRKLIPKVKHHLKADVLWVVLMGPESFALDLYRKWDQGVGLKILYLFDTMENQLPSIRRVLGSTTWDYTFTSFRGAVPFLEEQTQRRWLVAPQGVKLERFRPAPLEERLIGFCAYGRRLKKIHESIKEFCAATGKHYEYSTAASLQPQIDPRENHEMYAWHLGHTIFNFNWPVELTHPTRVRTFSPITCRWFEAAASGNVIIGLPPTDPTFNDIFGKDLVIPICETGNADALKKLWEKLWEERECHLARALERRERLAHKWSWESRIREILGIVGSEVEK
jgi:hypothetical protein